MLLRNALLLSTALAISAGVSQAQMTVVNGASFDSGGPLAPGSFATMFGQGLCGQTATADWIAPGQLPTTIGGCSIMVNGTPAMMHYVSPGQVNFIVPEHLGPGTANVVLNNSSGVLNGSMMIGRSGPGIFAMSGMGVGEGAFLHGMMWQRGPFSVTTNGQPTPIAIYMTGLDLSTPPTVMIGGVPAEVTFHGNAPGYVGLQQVNCVLPQNIAGAGQVPVTVMSSGQTSNAVHMTLLPTTAMMTGMPGWGSGMMIGENSPRSHEISYLAHNPANNTVLVSDENDDVVRVISLTSNTTAATITLPAGSVANAIAVEPTGRYAAIALSAKASVALVDLSTNQAVAVIGTGYYPSHVAFAGTNLLVTNSASGTVSVIDLNSRTASRTVNVGFGPSGIAAAGNLAVVANMQGGSVSLINLADFSVSTVSLPLGSRPHEVAISTATNQAVITNPMSNGALLLNLGTKAITPVDIGFWNAMGPGAVATNGSLAFIASQMTASVTVLDVGSAKVLKTFSVDPGPRALAVNPAKDQLLVLAEGTGTLDVVDLGSYGVVTRINAGETHRQGTWNMPLITSITPNSAAVGSTFTLTIIGSNFQGVKEIEFHQAGSSHGGTGEGMMGGGTGMGGDDDSNIKVSNVQVTSDGTRITATVQILATAAAGSRQVRLETNWGEVGMMFNSLFTVTSR